MAAMRPSGTQILLRRVGPTHAGAFRSRVVARSGAGKAGVWLY
jgi:hypothetical protein